MTREKLSWDDVSSLMGLADEVSLIGGYLILTHRLLGHPEVADNPWAPFRWIEWVLEIDMCVPPVNYPDVPLYFEEDIEPHLEEFTRVTRNIGWRMTGV